MMRKRLNRLVELKFDHIFVVLLYSLAVIIKFPALLKNISTHIAGKGDSLLNVFILESMYHNVTSNLSGFFTVPIYFPEKLSYAFNVNLLGLQFINFPVRIISGNPVLSHNIVFISGFVLSAWCTYILIKRFIPHPEIAFIGGLFVGFSPVFLIRTNIAFCSIYVIPLAFMYFDKSLRGGTWKNFLMTGFLFVVSALITFHHMYFLFICFIVYFFLFAYYNSFQTCYKKILVTLALVIVILTPFLYPYYVLSEKYEFKRSIGQTVQYSADALYSYLPIQPDSRTFEFEYDLFDYVAELGGDRVRNAVGVEPGASLSLSFFNDIWDSGRHEANNFIGFVPFILMGLLIVKKRQHRYNPQWGIFLLMAFTFYILSLGSVLVIAGHLTYIPLPFLPLYYLIPGFESMRVTARFGFMFVLFASVLSCYSIYYLRSMLNQKLYYFGILALSLLFILEADTGYLNKSILYEPYTKETLPTVYKWLERQEITGGVLEIPTISVEQTRDQVKREIKYIYIATIHNKPLANGSGAFFSPIFMEIRDMMYNFPDEPARKYLKEMQINTVIVHKTELDEQEKEFWADLLLQIQYIEILYEDSNDVVVKLI